MGPEYLSYEGVLAELQLDEDDLDQMIQDGQIAAIPDGQGKMWFLRTQISALKEDREGMQTITWEKGDGERFGFGRVHRPEATPPPMRRTDPPPDSHPDMA